MKCRKLALTVFGCCSVSFTVLNIVFNIATPTCKSRNSTLSKYYPIYLLDSNNLNIAAEPKNFKNTTVIVRSSKLCKYPTGIVFIIHSHSANVERRTYLRKRYFTKGNLHLLNASILFVVGRKGGDPKKNFLQLEADTFDDILQVNLLEEYHSITHKARVWISFLYRNCISSTKYIVKLDDDVLMNFDLLNETLKKFQRSKRTVICKVFPAGVVTRNARSKWYLSREEYAGTSLGLYCQGMAYILTADLIATMYANIAKVQYLWMDDWYVTHALLNASKAVFVDIGQHYLSINDDQHLQSVIKNKPNHPILFAHFRPPEKYSQMEQIRIWDNLNVDC